MTKTVEWCGYWKRTYYPKTYAGCCRLYRRLSKLGKHPRFNANWWNWGVSIKL